MGKGRIATLTRLGKPVVAGLALAYLATGFLDRPAPVHFEPDNPYAARQTAIAEPLAKLVVEKNILKLGSPLSVTKEEERAPEENPLAVLGRETPASGDAVSPEAAPEGASPSVAPAQDNATPAVRGEVDTVAVPPPDPAAP
ncbi:hypothetical protein [Pseudodesulfovibrio sp.]|uniref:hypothetical protein n=1 Tax=Pseudodesulfovibrio sp. TaxID=2035812 RepID=UPI0026252EF4|nr:hypothetical protein [Pseudodesulfovibrio sp.]MDD3313856.1 hypothetical protein [Pseudodesulfovibrio sp.]